MLRDNLVGLIEPMLSSAGANPLALPTATKKPSDDRPPCLENPRPEGAELTLTENAPPPFHAEPKHFRPRAILRLIASLARNPYVGIGVLAMAVSFFALMALLSTTNLSFAVPATAFSYVLETALAKYILKEYIGWRRWAGASLVGCGVLLVSLGV
jgi:multidrug transporter EmrE-like cation transporter